MSLSLIFDSTKELEKCKKYLKSNNIPIDAIFKVIILVPTNSIDEKMKQYIAMAYNCKFQHI